MRDDTGTKMVNALDLSAIEEKINTNTYKCFEDFLCDIKWIVHNTIAYRPSE